MWKICHGKLQWQLELIFAMCMCCYKAKDSETGSNKQCSVVVKHRSWRLCCVAAGRQLNSRIWTTVRRFSWWWGLRETRSSDTSMTSGQLHLWTLDLWTLGHAVDLWCVYLSQFAICIILLCTSCILYTAYSTPCINVCFCRQDFVTFLNRPDHKQQFVSEWQKVCLAQCSKETNTFVVISRELIYIEASKIL